MEKRFAIWLWNVYGEKMEDLTVLELKDLLEEFNRETMLDLLTDKDK